ncbi:MAG: NAD(P)-dependent oxidoreductase [Oscillospiraceae bacterium]
MNKFKKLVVIEPINITKDGLNSLGKYADEVILYDTIPSNSDEIAKRIGDCDAVLISYTSTLSGEAMSKCQNLKYVGMCCSLYSEESASVDIKYAKKNNIIVTGVNDYGDNGVVEYVLYELCSVLHGFGDIMLDNSPREISGLKIGMLGIGATGGLIADALQTLGGNISYFARNAKPEKEKKGMKYLPLDDLLKQSDVIFCCLNKNVVLLEEEQFKLMKGKKLIFNTSIAPSHNISALKNWLLESDEHYFFGDCPSAIGNEELLQFKNVRCVGNISSGCTIQSFERLTNGVFENINNFLLTK